jgi:hypothetical protein
MGGGVASLVCVCVCACLRGVMDDVWGWASSEDTGREKRERCDVLGETSRLR